MNTEKALIPSRRFPNYHDEKGWKQYKLSDITSVITDKCGVANLCIETYISTENILPNYGGIKIASKLPKTGTFTCFKKGDVLFSNIRPYLKKVWLASFDGVASNDIIVFRALAGFDASFVSCIIKSDAFIAYSMIGAKGVKMPRGDKDMMLHYDVYVPNIEEQKEIAACLLFIDSYISSIYEKVEQLKAHKKSLMQKLFPQRGQTVPEYRFSEFQKDSAWEKMKLGDVTTVINRRNKSNRSLPIYSISNKDGFVLQSEQFDGLDSESRGYDISLYKIVGRNTFAYNPARINIGSIGYSGNLKEVLISSLYVCFKTTDELDDEFLQCFLKTAEFNQAVDNNVEGGIRSYLFYENFSRIRIALPSLQEQKKIATTILSIDDVISKYTNKVSLLNDYKKGLMQQLFPTITK